MVSRNLVNIGSGNDLLPDSTKPLPEPMFINHQWGLAAFTSLIEAEWRIYVSVNIYPWFEFENDLLKITAVSSSGPFY